MLFSPPDWGARFSRLARALAAFRRIFFVYSRETLLGLSPGTVRRPEMEADLEIAFVAWQVLIAVESLGTQGEINRSQAGEFQEKLYAVIDSQAGGSLDRAAYNYFILNLTTGDERYGRRGMRHLTYYLSHYLAGDAKWDEFSIFIRETEDFMPELADLAHWHALAIASAVTLVCGGKKVDLFWHAFLAGDNPRRPHAEEKMQYEFEAVLMQLRAGEL